ncbi:succinate dehydrogenase assembly factor 3, mitochondrial [Onthophagus taurus]|uniref:succinate dehydrogenase assembly factor 3, mitochondrial n=1 Tax=Onthophagus taurus TaxID=166361 RepID=UPI000C20CB71|nr:succinate dehydrogenase assembly factor 3, mitochondrial [Onthophagus taurus]
MVYDHGQAVRLLYKTILKLHRGLPPAMQELGTRYAREEFRRHKKCTPDQALIFVNEWTDYAITLAKQLGVQGIKKHTEIGKALNDKDLDHFRPEQVQQLYELMLNATGREKDKINDKT